MAYSRTKSLAGGLATLFAAFAAAPELSAQARLTLPAGTVIMVRTTTALESSTARVGQTFETIVDDTVQADDYTVIPGGSRIRGTITFVQPANRQQSGVIEVNFDRLTLSDGRAYSMVGRLTSTDAAERRQIDADANARVVLVGGRTGAGAVIAGAGSANNPASGILAALGTILSSGRDVRVAAGTPLAVQLDQDLTLTRRGSPRAPGAYTIYTATDRIRAAQQALQQQNYYRGAITGRLDEATQRALFEYQSDKGLTATGNLDWRTAQALGISATGGTTGTFNPAILSPDQASQLRRNAQMLAARERQDIGVATNGRFDTRRGYGDADVELWFALSAFADNASLYERLVSASGNVSGSAPAGRALLSAARRADAAFQSAQASQQVRNAWASIRNQLSVLDSNYR
ncbi:MAG: peptidoglycan-binding domain-containing protein [Gemmatimonadaceae bacterium]